MFKILFNLFVDFIVDRYLHNLKFFQFIQNQITQYKFFLDSERYEECIDFTVMLFLVLFPIFRVVELLLSLHMIPQKVGIIGLRWLKLFSKFCLFLEIGSKNEKLKISKRLKISHIIEKSIMHLYMKF